MDVAVAFSKLYCENQEQKTQLKDFKNLWIGQKSAHKIGDKEGMPAEEIAASQEVLSALHRDARKGALRASQESARPHPLQAPGTEEVIPLRGDHGASCSHRGA